MSNLVGKTIQLELVGLDGNAFALMGAFRTQARREGWSTEECNIVLDECKKSDYDNLLCTLMDHCESPDDEEDDSDMEDDEEDIEDDFEFEDEEDEEV